MDMHVRSLVRRLVAELLEIEVDDVSDETRFRDLGLGSAQTVSLVSLLSQQLARPIPVAAAWEFPTVVALASYLSSASHSASASISSSRHAAGAREPNVEEPIAIVGMGCRFPGGIYDPSQLWAALWEGLDAVSEVPKERWDLNKWFDPDPQAPGKMSTRWGAFIEDVRGFDASFFRISAKEAAQMDPQQRLSLEVTWEALEDAGIAPGTLAGSRTGVFVGVWSHDYADLGADAAIEQHSATGWNNSIIPARIAYALALEGPALTVNTACSSSLVAVHLGMQSLRSCESDLALVSAVNLLLAPQTTVQMTKLGAMSPTGRCRAFAADADGYVRGEGCGTIVLRRLSDALQSGERIYALIRASAVNNDGASNGLTAPNPDAQRAVLQDAWRRSGVPTHDVSYVEAHGTGTPLGDPIEASALGSVFGKDRGEPLRVGSVKTNFGHLEGAAGIAGLMKTALALHHGGLPASLHFDQANPLIPFEQLGLRVVDERASWPSESERHAGVSSFGYGGTNAHVALSEAPRQRRVLLPLAVESDAEAMSLAQRFRVRLDGVRGERALHALVEPPGAGSFRAVVKGRHPQTLAAALQQLAQGDALGRAEHTPKVVFVFSGHGSQWLGMGRELLATEPTFSEALRECDRLIESEAGWSVISELCAPSGVSRLERTDVAQPVLFALQVALARMLHSWGIKPCAVLGQSIGEVAAAVIAGALSTAAGSRLIVRWSSLVARTVSGHGAMVVASLSRSQAEAWLHDAEALGIRAGDLAISGHLAPQSVSFAGKAESICTLQRALLAEGVRVLPVAIDYACHSPLMQVVAHDLIEELRDLVPTELSIPMWSTVAARYVACAELGAGYWAENLQKPIELVRAVAALAKDATHFIDIGPHPISLRSIEATLVACPESSAVVLGTCFRAESAWRGLEELASSYWCAGGALDWHAFAGLGASEKEPSTPIPLLLSAKDESALRAQAGRWASWLERHPETPWADVVHTAARRTHFERRASLTVSSSREAVDALLALNQARPHSCVIESAARPLRHAVFVFPGQGSQWPGMGKAMLEESAVFAEAVSACDLALRPYTGWSVLAVLRGEDGPDSPSLERIDVVQPALFAMNVALAAVWQSLGVEPLAVVGHSQGEIAAGVVSGALTLEDGARVVALRSQLLRRLSGSGAMATIELAVDAVEQKLRDARWSDLHVAVVNTNTSTVVAGNAQQIDAWVEEANREGIFCRRVAVDYASHTPHVDPILAELKAALSALRPRATQVPMISSVTGEPISGHALDADYWCRNLREPVRLDRALAHLVATHHDVFIEASAHPVLSMALGTVAGERRAVVGSLRRDAGGLRDLYANLAALHVAGYPVDWAARSGPQALAALPTYAFQHQSYWLARPLTHGNVTTAGLSAVSHPFLRSLTSLADSERFLLTGRISLSDQGWLSDHAIFGAVVVPGTAVLELLLSTARVVGCTGVSELTLSAPLVLTEQAPVRLQIQVEPPNGHGRRPFLLFSRAEDAGEDLPWTQHAAGELLSSESRFADLQMPKVWPPPGAAPVDLSEAYQSLAALGYEYGESFQCLRSAWKSNAQVFAHVVLPKGIAGSAGQYGVQPALLDAALHAVLIAGFQMDGSGPLLLPFTWSEVSQYRSGASELRVRFALGTDGDGTRTVSLTATDERGQPVLRAGALSFRQATREQVCAASPHNRDLYRVDFRPAVLSDIAANCRVVGGSGRLAEALGVGHSATVAALLASLGSGSPNTLVIDATSVANPCQSSGASGLLPTLPRVVHDATVQALGGLQTILAEPRLGAASLVWVTERAVATPGDDDAPLNVVAAPIWGLIRSARSENPDRTLRLIDLDEPRPAGRMLQRLIATTSEPELVLRRGHALVPRLSPVRNSVEVKRPNLEGTVLVTGGLGQLGRSLAHHLVAEHGVKHLVLTSRRGMETSGAQELLASLEQAGAHTVTVAACDVAMREQLATLVDSISRSHAPLCAVFHLAGILDDGLVTGLTPEQLGKTLRPKVDGAWHLHELTRDCPISAFVLFSSVAGVLGFQGQANYAASNLFLDALAAERRRLGLPAQSLAWGFWEPQGIGMSAHLGRAEIARMARQGIAPLPFKAGFALLDHALMHSETTLVPARLDLSSLTRELASVSLAPALLRSVVARAPRLAPSVASPEISGLCSRLLALPESERRAAILSAAREEVASVLGLRSIEVGVDSPLRSLGLDSLMAVELKARLSRRFETVLPATLAFDYPTLSAIAGLLGDKLKLERAPKWSDQEVRRKLERVSIDALRASGVLELLMSEEDDDVPARPSYVAPKPDLDIDEVEGDALLDEMERMLEASHG